MQPPRKLTLKSETLTELTAGELHAVVGGQDTTRCASRDCPTAAFTCFLTWSERMCEPELSGQIC